MNEKEIPITTCAKCSFSYAIMYKNCPFCKSKVYETTFKHYLDKLACPYCESDEILFMIKIGRWECLDCSSRWDKFEPGMEFKIGLYCKWGRNKKWDIRLQENHMHGELWCHQPKNYPFQTLKPFTCKCEAFQYYLSDLIDCSGFWYLVERIWTHPDKEDVEAWKKEFRVCCKCGDLAFHTYNNKPFCKYHLEDEYGGPYPWR